MTDFDDHGYAIERGDARDMADDEHAAELEELRQYVRTQDAVMRARISEVEARNAEATALLEQPCPWCLCVRAPAQPAAPTPVQVECTMCHRPAACFGSYENNTSWGYSCNECCGHGNEDGCCFPLADIPERYLALVKRLSQLEDELPAAPEPSADFPSTIRKAKEWQARAESAEARLAAVRKLVVLWRKQADDYASQPEAQDMAPMGPTCSVAVKMCAGELEDELTPAPSPGAGEPDDAPLYGANCGAHDGRRFRDCYACQQIIPGAGKAEPSLIELIDVELELCWQQKITPEQCVGALIDLMRLRSARGAR